MPLIISLLSALFAQPASAGPGPIVGYWRNAQGAARFNADGRRWLTARTAGIRLRAQSRIPLEKRNHPKTGDPMLVLNGQPFVTYFQHPRW
jgi:hypothetical protein